jgi:predicted peptidase
MKKDYNMKVIFSKRKIAFWIMFFCFISCVHCFADVQAVSTGCLPLEESPDKEVKDTSARDYHARVSKTVYVKGTKGDTLRFEQAGQAGYLRLKDVSGISSESITVGRIDTTEKFTGRDYSIYVPQNYNPEKSWPLVIDIHGAGGTGKSVIRSWEKRAEKRGFIAACPTCVTARKRWPGEGTYKQWFMKESEKDMEVILGMLGEILESYNIDAGAVLLTGFSGGGYPTYYTGLRHPDIFSAIAVRSGNFWAPSYRSVEATPSLRKLRVYIVSGEKDHRFILKAAPEARNFLTGLGLKNIKYEVIPEMKHADRARNKVLDWFFQPYLKDK